MTTVATKCEFCGKKNVVRANRRTYVCGHCGRENQLRKGANAPPQKG